MSYYPYTITPYSSMKKKINENIVLQNFVSCSGFLKQKNQYSITGDKTRDSILSDYDIADCYTTMDTNLIEQDYVKSYADNMFSFLDPIKVTGNKFTYDKLTIKKDDIFEYSDSETKTTVYEDLITCFPKKMESFYEPSIMFIDAASLCKNTVLIDNIKIIASDVGQLSTKILNLSKIEIGRSAYSSTYSNLLTCLKKDQNSYINVAAQTIIPMFLNYRKYATNYVVLYPSCSLEYSKMDRFTFVGVPDSGSKSSTEIMLVLLAFTVTHNGHKPTILNTGSYTWIPQRLGEFVMSQINFINP